MTRVFRKKSTACTLAAFCFLLIGKVTAEPLNPKVSEPISYKDFLYGVDEVRKNIETVQCGGWEDTDASVSGYRVDGSVPIPTIEGVPGRKNKDPLGDPKTGLGTRGDFQYPDADTTWGYMTACDIHNEEINPEKLCIKENNTATPESCKKLYKRLTEELPQMVANGTFSSGDPKVMCRTFVGTPPAVTVVKNYCFQYNSECVGEACRTKNPPVFRCLGPIVIAKESSFYRHYDTTVATPDGQVWEVDTECYEQYKETDPKDIMTKAEDEQCEIVLPDGDRSPEWDMDASDQKGNVKPPADETQEPPSSNRIAAFPWVKDSGTTLTIFDYASWKKRQEEHDLPLRLSDALANPIESTAQASKSIPQYSTTDSFDDTAERDIAKFWEEQQRELLRITRDPEVRLVLPARFLHGLSDKDALFQMIREVPSESVGLVEVTLRSGLDDLGLVLQSFAESQLFTMQEVRIPILVPVAGDIEMRIADWEQWKAASEAAGSEHAGKADPILDVLRRYQSRRDEIRVLRGALLTYIGQNLEADRIMREKLLAWYKSNADLLKQATEQNEARRRVQRVWQRVQNAMLIVDECQLLWCSNQRYSAPVYSLLDNWWRDEERQPPGSPRDRSYVPQSVSYYDLTQPEDLLFDFSTFTFPAKDPILVPVLWPIQVKLNLPIPPTIGAEPESADAFPPLPSLPDANVFSGLPALSVRIPDLPTLKIPQGPSAEMYRAVEEVVKKFRKIVDGTPVDDPKAEEEYATGIFSSDMPPVDLARRDSMQGAICRFPYSVTVRREDEMKSNPKTLVHTENDLRERIGRIFARWMPNRTEDFAGRVIRRAVESPANSKCHEGIVCLFLPQQKQTRTTFNWFVPKQQEDFEQLRDLMKEITLPKDGTKNPYLHSRLPILRRLFPNQVLPDWIDLTPDE